MSWQPIGLADELKPGNPKIVSVDGKEIGVFCEGDRYFAVLNHCPHNGAPICQGRVSGRVVCDSQGTISYDDTATTLRCPWHHWEFDLLSGRAVTPIRERLKVYRVKIFEGTIYVQLG